MQLWGRGVGLDVMRATLRLFGGDLSLRFVAARRAGHQPFELVHRH